MIACIPANFILFKTKTDFRNMSERREFQEKQSKYASESPSWHFFYFKKLVSVSMNDNNKHFVFLMNLEISSILANFMHLWLILEIHQKVANLDLRTALKLVYIS